LLIFYLQNYTLQSQESQEKNILHSCASYAILSIA